MTPEQRTAPALLDTCPVCGKSDAVRLTPDWRVAVEQWQKVPIVGCGNPWHYIGLEPDALTAANAALDAVVDAVTALGNKAKAVEADADALRDVLARMPDAGLAEGDPRYDWWWNVVVPVLDAHDARRQP